MSGFVATDPGSSQPDAIINDGWFPDLSIDELRDVARLDGTITDPRLRAAAAYAISEINKRLAAFRTGHEADGVATLAGVPAAGSIDGQHRLVMLYKRAVAALIKADLIERYRDFDSTDSGLRRVADMEPAIGDHRRNATWAVRDILGQPHVVAELI